MAKKPGNPKDPFIVELRMLLGSRDNDHYAQRKRQDSGQASDRHLTAPSRHFTSETIGHILSGEYVPSLGEVSQLAEDAGLAPGKTSLKSDITYAELNRLGDAYYEAYHPDRKAPAIPPPEKQATPSQSLSQELKRIRSSRYRYPFSLTGTKLTSAICTQEELDALPKNLAKQFKRLNITDTQRVLRDYHETDARNFTTGQLDKAIAFLSCSPEEEASLRRLQREDPQKFFMSPSDAEAFRLLRENRGKTQGSMLRKSDQETISDIENAIATQAVFEAIVRRCGFKKMDDFYEAARPPERRQVKLSNRTDRINPDDAVILERYLRKSGRDIIELSKKAGYNGTQPIITALRGDCSQDTFDHIIKTLGFADMEALCEAETSLPDTRTPRKVAPRSTQRRGR